VDCHEDTRGRRADTPSDIPPRGWKEVLQRVYSEVSDDRILLIAAGITFYGLLALFPGLAALVSVYGFFADPVSVASHLQALSNFLPQDAINVIGTQLDRLARLPASGLTVGFAVGLAVALWSANSGMKAMFEGLNVAYGEKEERGFFRLTTISLFFTIGAIGAGILSIAAIVIVPAVLNYFGAGGLTDLLVRLSRWPLLLAIIVLALAFLYRFGPSRRSARWRWISPGSLAAGILWIVVSGLFSWYITNFGNYNETYGTLGATIVFMIWLWISASIILLGAELNAELEHQTERDTTTSGDKPMGQRGAHMADTVAKSSED
jgi:membrane protein